MPLRLPSTERRARHSLPQFFTIRATQRHAPASPPRRYSITNARRLLAPRDLDIRANLQHVRTEAGLPSPGNWFTQNARIANPNLMFWLATVGIALLGASLLGRRLSKTQRTPLAGAAAIGLVLTLAGVTDAVATAPDAE